MNGGGLAGTQMPGGVLSSQAYAQTANGRQSHVQEQMQRSACVVKSISDRMSLLLERLQPVLRMEPQGGQTGKDAPKPTLVGHANALSNQSDQLEIIDSYLSSILDRLEL